MVVNRRGTRKSLIAVGFAIGLVTVTACTGADSSSGGGKYFRYGYDLAYDDIAVALGSSAEAARQAASSGVRRLRKGIAR